MHGSLQARRSEARLCAPPGGALLATWEVTQGTSQLMLHKRGQQKSGLCCTLIYPSEICLLLWVCLAAADIDLPEISWAAAMHKLGVRKPAEVDFWEVFVFERFDVGHHQLASSRSFLSQSTGSEE